MRFLSLNEEHLKLKNEFSIFFFFFFFFFFVKNIFLTENHTFREFLQTSRLTYGYPGFQKKKRFCDEMILKTRVKVNVQPLGPSTRILVTTNFRGIRTLTQFLEKGKTMKFLNLMYE